MGQKIQEKKFYLQKLKEEVETAIKLSQANLKLLSEKEKKLEEQLKDIRSAMGEWVENKKEAENKLQNPDLEIKRMLTRDFRSEVSLRKNGGDRQMAERYGQVQYGIHLKNRNKHRVTIPRLKRDGERKWYENEEVEIQEECSNEKAFREWEIYMNTNLDIRPDWDFDTLFEKIEKFFSNVPNIEVYGKPYEVYVIGGQLYQRTGE